jgi:hypothetical protein
LAEAASLRVLEAASLRVSKVVMPREKTPKTLPQSFDRHQDARRSEATWLTVAPRSLWLVVSL